MLAYAQNIFAIDERVRNFNPNVMTFFDDMMQVDMR